MNAIKNTYVREVHRYADLGIGKRFSEAARKQAPESITRWAASLLSIYNSEGMIALDCPWWNVAATTYVDRFLASRRDAKILEWGAGASSIWLARRAKEVISVEHDMSWFRLFEPHLAEFPNARNPLPRAG